MDKKRYGKIFCAVFFAVTLFVCLELSAAEQTLPFVGQARDDDVNIRADSTVGAQVICTVKKGSRLEVVSENYDWYKVRLPKQAPAYLKKDLAECMDLKADESLATDLSAKTVERCQNAKISGSRVNIRLSPSESSPILGKADENEMVTVVSETSDWYKIVPIQNSFGWIHKKFVKKAPAVEVVKAGSKAVEVSGESVIIEGMVKPYGKIFKRVATHKLITDDNKIFLLKGDKESLNAVNHHRAKITGKTIGNPNQKYPTVEVKVLEVID